MKEEGKCAAFLRMPSDDLAGDAKRRVPIPKRRRKANDRRGEGIIIDMIPVPLSFLAAPRREKPGNHLLYINIRDAKAAEFF